MSDVTQRGPINLHREAHLSGAPLYVGPPDQTDPVWCSCVSTQGFVVTALAICKAFLKDGKVLRYIEMQLDLVLPYNFYRKGHCCCKVLGRADFRAFSFVRRMIYSPLRSITGLRN